MKAWNADQFAHPERVLESLRDYLDFSLEALDNGNEQATLFFEKSGYAYDPWLHAHIVRAAFKDQLGKRAAGLPNDLVPADIALGGLELSNSDYVLRVLKATYRLNTETMEPESHVPGPRYSRTRERFYWQLDLAFQGQVPLFDPNEPLHLVELWDADRDHQLVFVDLACPKLWNKPEQRVELFWRVPLLGHDAGTIAIDPSVSPLPLDDIDLKPLDADEASDSGAG